MILSNISASNLKGASFSESLSPMTAIIGGNASGKSARLDAIRLALLGYLPELGKENKATFGLSSGSEMTVDAILSDGQLVGRSWRVKGNSVTKEEAVPEIIEKAAQLSVMLDASVYFSLSDQKRIEYVFGLCDMGTLFTAGGIIDRVGKKIAAANLGGEAGISALEGLSSIITPTVQEWVDSAIETTTGKFKLAREDLRKCESTIVKLTQMRAADIFTGPAINEFERRKVEAETEIAHLNEEKGKVVAEYGTMKNARVRREQINRELSQADKTKLLLANAQEKLALVEQQEAAAPIITQTMIADSANTISSYKSDLRILESFRNTATGARIQAEQDLAHLDGATVCPYCGATGEGWKALKAAEYAQDVDKYKADAEKNETAAVMLRQSITIYADAHAKMIDTQGRARELENTRNACKTEISRLQPQIARLSTLTEERDRLPVDDPALTTKVESIQSQLNVREQDKRHAEAGIAAAQGRQQEVQRMAEAETQRDTAKAEIETLTAVGKELKVIQSEMVAAAFGPLIDAANGFFGDVLLTPLVYHEKEIGTFRDGLFVSHATMSGSEKALVYAAIQAALASFSPVRLMILDEMGRFSDRTLENVLTALSRATKAGTLDQVIFADAVRDAFTYLNHCKVIQIA